MNILDRLFNSTNNVPDNVLKVLYKEYSMGVSFLVFQSMCDDAAIRYNVDADYLSSYIIDEYENNHPEIFK